MQIRLLCVPLCLGWILFGAQPSWAQDLSAAATDPDKLQQQIAALEPMIVRLKACAEQPDGFASLKQNCQKALEQRTAQRKTLQEIADLRKWRASPDVPDNVKQDMNAQIAALQNIYASIARGASPRSPAPPTPPPTPTAAPNPPPAAALAPGRPTGSSQLQTLSATPQQQNDPEEKGKKIDCLTQTGMTGLCGGQLVRTIVASSNPA